MIRLIKRLFRWLFRRRRRPWRIEFFDGVPARPAGDLPAQPFQNWKNRGVTTARMKAVTTTKATPAGKPAQPDDPAPPATLPEVNLQGKHLTVTQKEKFYVESNSRSDHSVDSVG